MTTTPTPPTASEETAEDGQLESLRAQLKEERDKVRDVDGIAAYVNQDPQRWERIAPRKFKCHKTLRGHLAKVYALDWGGEAGQNIVSASQDGKLLVWDAVTGNKIFAIPLQNAWVMTCAYSASGSLVAAGGLDNCCSVYSLRQGNGSTQREKCKLEGHTGYLSSCQFLRDDKQMMTASGDHSCQLWDLETRNPVTCFRGHEADVMTLALSKDQRTMVTGACDKTCKLWDIESGQCVQTFTSNNSDVNSVAYHPSGLAFACGSDSQNNISGECLLFDIRSDQCVAEYFTEKAGNPYGVMSIDFSKSGSILFAGMDTGNVIGWDVPAGTEVVHLSQGGNSGHESRVNCLQVSPDGQALVTGSWDNTLKVWN